MNGVLDELSEATYQILAEVYHDLGSRILLVYEDIYEKYKMVMRASNGYRSIDQQNDLYALGRTKPGKIITNAQGGESWHNFGLAVDSCFHGKDPYLDNHPKGQEIWDDFGKFCTNNGLIWGGNFLKLIDKPHAEKRYNMTLKACKILVDQVGIEGLWKQLDARLQDIHNQETMH